MLCNYVGGSCCGVSCGGYICGCGYRSCCGYRLIVVAVVAGAVAVAVAGQRWVVAGFRNQHEGRIAEKKSTPNVQK